MNKLIRQLAASAALVGAALLPTAQAATVIDFEGAALAGLYFPGDTFAQGGFTMTVNYDFGVVGSAGDLGNVAPSGNSTQFFFNSNDGYLNLKASNGDAFSLDGFSAAFVPLVPAPSPNPTIVIVAAGRNTSGAFVGYYFGLGSSSTTSYPFLSFNTAGAYQNMVSVDFYACVLDSQVCVTPTLNNGQFALDNLRVTAVPEPTTWLLMALGLAGIVVRRRRSLR